MPNPNNENAINWDAAKQARIFSWKGRSNPALLNGTLRRGLQLHSFEQRGHSLLIQTRKKLGPPNAPADRDKPAYRHEWEGSGLTEVVSGPLSYARYGSHELFRTDAQCLGTKLSLKQSLLSPYGCLVEEPAFRN